MYGRLVRLLLPLGLVDDPWNQHDAWASNQPGKSGQRFESSARPLPHDFIRVVDGLPKIENEAFAALQAQIVQAAVGSVGDGLRVLRCVEWIHLGISQTNTEVDDLVW